MEEANNSRKREVIATVAVLVVIVLIVFGVTLSNKKSDNSETNNTGASDIVTPTPATATTTDTSAASSSAAYKDGSYSASGSYSSPGGRESISVDLTLKDGTVTAVSAKTDPADDESEEYQNMFLSAYKELVIGKKVNSLKLDRVSGSSLTSQGFNSAVEQIRTKAQS